MLSVQLPEDRIPVHEAVRIACELLGLDPLHIGEIDLQPRDSVLVTTLYSGSRIVDTLAGDPLPRIC